MLLCDRSNLRHRINAGAGSGAHRGHHAAWPLARRHILLHHRSQCVGAHGKPGIHRNFADIALSDAHRNSVFLDRRVRLLRGVKRKVRLAALHPRFGRHHLPRAGDGVQTAHGSRVIDNAEPSFRYANPLPQPVQRALLQFGHCRRSLPMQAVGVECRGQHLTQDCRR